MAITASRTHVLTIGGAQIMLYDLTFTGVTGGKIKTGMANVFSALYSPSTTDDHGTVHCNYSDAGSTESRGDVYVNGVTSNDTGKLIVIGSA